MITQISSYRHHIPWPSGVFGLFDLTAISQRPGDIAAFCHPVGEIILYTIADTDDRPAPAAVEVDYL